MKKLVKKANKGKLGKVSVEEISLGKLNKVAAKLNDGLSIKIKPAKGEFKVSIVEGLIEDANLSKKELKALTKAIKKEKKGTEIVLSSTLSLNSLNSLLEEFDEIAKIKLVISEGETVMKVKFSYDEVAEDEVEETSTCTGNCGSCDCKDEEEEEDYEDEEIEEEDDEEVIKLPTEVVVETETKKSKKNKKKKNKK